MDTTGPQLPWTSGVRDEAARPEEKQKIPENNKGCGEKGHEGGSLHNKVNMESDDPL